MILSGIDIGTNSLRLLIADTGPGSLKRIYSDRRTTRLGENLDRDGLLSPAARARSLQALVEFRKNMDRHGVHAALAVGTSALRNAGNSPLFISEVYDRTGIEVKIITGEDEARLILRGVLAASAPAEKRPENTAVVDIGGGSTEIILIGRNTQTVEISLPLGAVYLTERFLKSDPPSLPDLEMIRNEVRKCLGRARSGPVACLIGTAGTITTLSSIHQKLVAYDPDRINNSVLSRAAVADITARLSASSLKERRKLQGLEPGREDIIVAGSIVAEEIMDYYKADRMLVSDWGLREGIILDLYDKLVMSGAGTKAV